MLDHDPEDPSIHEADEVPSGQVPSADGLELARQISQAYQKSGTPIKPRNRRRRPERRTEEFREPAALSDILNDVVRRQGWESRISAQRVFSDWASIVGPEVAQHSKVVAFKDSVVEVRTTSTAWATQMRMLAPRIVAKLNEELGDGSVTRINVKGPQAPSWNKGARSIRGARGPRDTYG